jgi:hypothetical protein
MNKYMKEIYAQLLSGNLLVIKSYFLLREWEAESACFHPNHRKGFMTWLIKKLREINE